MNNEDIQPGIWYYGLALLIAVMGFAAFAGSIYSGISHVESSLPQMLAPGEADFNLSEPGEYTVFCDVYQVNASYEESDGPEVVLAIGKGILEGLFSSVLTSLAVLFGSIAIAVAVAFITYTRRKKALDRKKEEDRQIRGLSR